jgi:glycine/D-amino acid oxidase-like deaminating enzyme
MTGKSSVTSHPDVLIVGGGVIGTSVLYHLARAGVRARLLERAGLCGGASGANGALVWPQGMKRTLSLEMSLASHAMLPDLSSVLDIDLEFHTPGGMIAVEEEAHLGALRQYLATQAEAGLPAELLDGDEARRREPALGRNVRGALSLPLGGAINPFRLIHCLKPIKHDQDWTRFSQAWPPDPAFGRFGAAGVEDPNLPPGKGMGIHQTAAGNIILGSTSRFVGLDRRPTPGGIRYILEHATRLLPGLGKLEVIRTWAGLRPFTPDGLPLLGPSGLPGLLLATGHDGSGLALGPLTGRLMAEMVTTGKMSFPLERLTPERFAAARPPSPARSSPPPAPA